ncbi:MAG TPA: hypothetical protein VME42_12015 [Steroidobacteraceae bacterium]|nr:hypothetical protein [Steroidobacteraceae bacterium]
MKARSPLRRCAAMLCGVLLVALAGAAARAGTGPHSALRVTVSAEVAATVMVEGHRRKSLVPAVRVVPGDEVFYTLEIRNTGSIALPPPTVDYPIPAHMRYLAGSAVGAGAQVSFSLDGGRSFGRPESLKVMAADGERPATAADYTHIRWQLKHILKAKSVALARFRAVVE